LVTVHAGIPWGVTDEDVFLSGSFVFVRVSGIAVHSKANASTAMAPRDRKEIR
jgi:hypothetical protein